MKWLSSKYAYPLIMLSIMVSIVLQVIWLRQLFISQKALLKQNIEGVVSDAAKNTMYASLIKDKNGNDRFVNNYRLKEFFLSPQWVQIRQAFDDLKINGVHNTFHYGIDADSTVVELKFNFSNAIQKKKEPVYDIRYNKETPAELKMIDNNSLRLMQATVSTGIKRLGVSEKTAYALYDYGRDTLISMSVSKAAFKSAAYTSGIYSYNLKYLHKYQLIIPRLNGTVIYLMRYYLLSSVLMVMFTGFAFYFLLRLIRNQRLYTDAKIAFTSNMTHEFKTPVATVAVALESIIKYNLANDPEKLNNYLNISQNELQRLNMMIEKVLNLNELDGGHNVLNLSSYDIQKGINDVLSSLKLLIDQQKAIVNFKSDGQPYMVNGDAMHMTNVFYNLIDNALKYASPNAVINISCGHQGNNVIISIQDNGPGIANIYQKKVFDRFFRIPTGNIHNVKGSGLGLHYVKEIIEEHKGTISIESEPGKGIAFIITIPAI